MTKGSKSAIGETVHETISNLMKKDTFLKAKDVLKFCQMTVYEMDWGWWNNPQLAMPLTKLLMRVVDFWNIHRDLGFNEGIHCYWNSLDTRKNIMAELYSRQSKIFLPKGIKYLLSKPKLRQTYYTAVSAYCRDTGDWSMWVDQ